MNACQRRTLSSSFGLAVVLWLGVVSAQTPEAFQQMESARRMIDEGRLEEAEPLLETVVEAAPEAAMGWALLGRVRALDRRFRAAEEPLRQAVRLGASDLGTLLLFGSTLWENGSLEEAEQVLRQAAAAAGDRLVAEHQLASLWLWQGRFEEAVPLLEDVVEGRPSWSGARLDLARAYQGVGAWAAAQTQFELYLQQVPYDAGARYGLARVLRVQGSAERAEEEMDRAAEIRRRDREVTRREGRLQAQVAQAVHLLQEGRPDAAIALLGSLPRSVAVLEIWARALRVQGDLEGAIGRLEEAIALDPSRRDLRTRLQELFLEAGPEP